mmetsp:Transcript_16661/g.20959  ORF Transcript_16661/g.20959 Transcript_16661/m.20959 type:complete len:99 (-) Transcript_16661:1079-1375(-)
MEKYTASSLQRFQTRFPRMLSCFSYNICKGKLIAPDNSRWESVPIPFPAIMDLLVDSSDGCSLEIVVSLLLSIIITNELYRQANYRLEVQNFYQSTLN